MNVPLKITASRDSWNWCNNTPKVYAQEWWQDTPDFNEATPITLTLGNRDATDVDFTLDLGGTISGAIFEADGTTPVTNDAWVDVNDLSGNWISSTGVASDGSYAITGLADGTYHVRAWGNGYATEFYNEAGPTFDNANNVVVVAGSDTPNIDFALDPGGTISGTVYAEDGVTPLPDMRVDVNNVWGIASCTDQNGHYALYNLPLNIPLTVNTGGNGNWCGGSEDRVLEWWQDAWSQDAATPITLTLGSPDASGIDFSLVLGGSISGHIYAI